MAFRVLQNCWVWRHYVMLLWGMAAVESMVMKQLLGREVSNGVFPWPQTILITKTIGRMKYHCFLRPIRRHFSCSSYLQSMCLQLPITFSFLFLYHIMSIDHLSVLTSQWFFFFFKEDKVRFTTQAIQIDLVPSRLRQLTAATGFTVARVTRVTGTSKRTFGIRAGSWRMAIMGTCCAFVYVWKNT